jgi:uncharacterized damage-inducible protein DinB
VTASGDLRDLLARHLDWHEAHATYDRAVADFPPALRGEVPAGFAHSGWHLVEHMRRAQADILDFCVNPHYVYPTSMDEYWPATAPGDDAEWDESVAAFHDDVRALKRLAQDESVDLLGRVPAGEGQTFLRELLLVADHNSYHLGQLVTLRRALGCWKDAPGWG